MKLLLACSFIFIGLLTTAQKTETLFNGKDLTGWTIHGTEKWYAENGELVCESGPDKQYGYLSTIRTTKTLYSLYSLSRKRMETAACSFVHKFPKV